MKYQQICHMITPGLDSIVTYFYIKEKIMNVPGIDLDLIHILLSPAYSHVEQEKLKHIEHKYLSDSVRYINLKDCQKIIQEGGDGFIPSRNLLLATILDSTAIPNRKYETLISFGFNADDRVYDSSDEYCLNASKVLSNNVSMGSIVRHMSKSELMKWFFHECTIINKPKKVELINETYSCYSGGEIECLACNACFRKSVILNDLKIETRPFKDLNLLKSRIGILSDDTVGVCRKESIRKYVDSLIENDPPLQQFLEGVYS